MNTLRTLCAFVCLVASPRTNHQLKSWSRIRAVIGAIAILAAVTASSAFVAAQDAAKPLKIQRYRDPSTQVHAFATAPEAEQPIPASFSKEHVPAGMAISPVFYLYTEPYSFTTAIHRFRGPDNSTVFAANEEERQDLVKRGLQEVDRPVFVYDRQVEGSSEIYRVASPVKGDMVYTTSPDEKDYYLKQGWVQRKSLGFTQAASSSGTGILLASTIKLIGGDLSLISHVEGMGSRIVFSGSNSKIASLSPGKILYSEKSEALPLGLIARVAAVRRNRLGETEIRTEPAELGDAFSEVHINLDNLPLYFFVPSETPAARPAEAEETLTSPGSGETSPEYLSSKRTGAISDAITITPIKMLPDGAEWGLVNQSYKQSLLPKGVSDTTYTLAVSGQLTIKATTELLYNTYNRCTTKPTVTFILSPIIEGSLSVNASVEASASSGDVPVLGPFTGSVNVGGIPIYITLKLLAGYTASAKVSATLTGSAQLRMSGEAIYDVTTKHFQIIGCPKTCPAGFSCGDPPATGATCSLTPKFDAKFDVDAQASVYLKPQIDFMLGGFGTGIGPNAYAKFQLQSKLEPPNVNVYAQLIPGVGASIQVCGITVGQASYDLPPQVNQQVASVSLITSPKVTSFKINNGVSPTANRSVTLNNTTSGNPTQYMASESSTFSGASWQPYSAAPSFTLSAGSGAKTVYFKVQNTAGVSTAASASITVALPAAITVTPTTTVAFGSVAVNSSMTQSFTVQNSGSGTLTGTASATAPFSIASGGSYTLAAGAQQTVTVRFSPTAAQSYTGSVSFTGGGGATRTVTGTGTQISAILAVVSTDCYQSGPEINLKFTLSSGTSTTFDLYRNGALYLAGISGTTFSNTGSKVVAGQSYSYYVVVHLTSGGTVTSSPVSATAPSNCGTGTIAVTPNSTVGFGSVAVGNSATQSFTVQNSGNGTLTGTASATTPFSIASGGSYSLTAGAHQTITVRFSPAAAQNYTGSINFTGGGGATRMVTGTGTQVSVNLAVVSTDCYQSGPEINLKFTLSGGASSYFDLYRGGALYMAGIAGTTFSNTGSRVTAGQSYSYYVVVHLTSGGIATSSPVSATAPSNCAPALSIPSSGFNPPTATVGTGYSAQQAMAASGGTLPYSWSISGQPNGMAMNPSSGALYGTPTSAGSFYITVTVRDSGNPQQTASKGLWLTVAAGGCGQTFCPGDVVTVYGSGGLNLRSCASTGCSVLTVMPDGTIMQVLGGPTVSGGYTWWNLSGYPGGVYRAGWAIGTYLKK